LVVAASVACTKPNPAYCTDSQKCPDGTQCDLASHSCVASPDAATEAGAACTVSPQQGCDTDKACRLDTCVQGVEMTECTQVGFGTSRSFCTGHGDCAAGFGCSSDLCRRYCGSTADCEAPGGECIDLACGSPENGTDVCTENCDPIPLTSECATGYRCSLRVASNPAHTECGVAGTVNGGGACTYDSDCRQGYACIGATSAFYCERLCIVGGPPCDVAAANGCVAIPGNGGDLMLGSNVIGYCSN
jgi:hypothetical protein